MHSIQVFTCLAQNLSSKQQIQKSAQDAIEIKKFLETTNEYDQDAEYPY